MNAPKIALKSNSKLDEASGSRGGRNNSRSGLDYGKETGRGRRDNACGCKSGAKLGSCSGVGSNRNNFNNVRGEKDGGEWMVHLNN